MPARAVPPVLRLRFVPRGLCSGACPRRRDLLVSVDPPLRRIQAVSRSVESLLLSFQARLRSPRRAFAVLAILGWVLVSQTLLVVHRIDHNATEHGVACSLCVAADHQLGAAAHTLPVLEPSKPDEATSTLAVTAPRTSAVPYRSRAPPSPLAVLTQPPQRLEPLRITVPFARDPWEHIDARRWPRLG